MGSTVKRYQSAIISKGDLFVESYFTPSLDWLLQCSAVVEQRQCQA